MRFVISLNEKRRHLSSNQKAVIALEVERLIGAEERRGRPSKEDIPQNFADLPEDRESRTQAATLIGTNRQYVSDAKRIAHSAPDLLEPIKQGEMTVDVASQIAKFEAGKRQQALQSIREGEKPRQVVQAMRRTAQQERLREINKDVPILGHP